MARTNTKKAALFFKAGSTLPIAPAGYLELEEALIPAVDIPIEEFKRVNGRLGSNDSYADTCHATISQTVSHKIREQNGAADALDTEPEFSDLLKVGGFDLDISETLVLTDVTGIVVGDTITGDTSSASGTVKLIDTTLNTIVVGGITGSPFTVGGETLNTAAYTATSAGFTVRYTNTQTTQLGSALIYLDGWKQSATGKIAADLTFNLPIGKTPTISAAFQSFLDNKGVAVAEATPDVTTVESTEACMVVGCVDIVTAGGTAITPDNVSIAMGADIQEFYGFNLAEYQMTDYMIKVTAEFYPDNADYNNAVTLLNNQTVEEIDIKVGTNAGALQNGKSMRIIAPLAKANSFSDSNDKDAVKRSFTWLLTGKEQLHILFGKFV